MLKCLKPRKEIKIQCLVKKPEGSGKPSQRIKVLDILTNESTIYDSMSAAASALGIKHFAISKYIRNNQKSPYKKRYIFKKV